MTSSEKMGTVTGRQYVAAAKIPIDATDFNAQSEFFLTDLPEGAVITSGHIFTSVAWTTSTTIALTVEDAAGNLLDTILAAVSVAATGIDVVTPTGIELIPASTVRLTVAGATPVVGTGYIYLEYIVDGRTHFSEG